MRSCVVVLALVACRGESKPRTQPPAPTKPAPAEGQATGSAAHPCEQLPFATSTPVPEASGAAWLDGSLVVVSDSGNDGAYAIIDAKTGDTREEGKLPLGGGSEDIEGFAARDGKIYGLSSSGWMDVWERDGKGFKLVDGPYAIGPIDMSDAKVKDSVAPGGTGMVCPMKGTNCGRNYEGLAIAPHDPRGINPLLCGGFACSKGDGHLYCLVEDGGRFKVDRSRSIAIEKPGTLADCAFSEDGTLYAGANFFNLGQVYRIDGWADPANAKVVPLEQLNIGFPEVIAARGDVIYRMSDTGGSPSLMAKFRCKPIER